MSTYSQQLRCLLKYKVQFAIIETVISTSCFFSCKIYNNILHLVSYIYHDKYYYLYLYHYTQPIGRYAKWLINEIYLLYRCPYLLINITNILNMQTIWNKYAATILGRCNRYYENFIITNITSLYIVPIIYACYFNFKNNTFFAIQRWFNRSNN